MTKKIAVIGAGLAGLTFTSIMKANCDVKVFEKSRGVGGRMSTRKEPPFNFDHGAQFFKIKTSDFMNFFSELFTKQIIQPWSFKLAYFEGRHLRKIKIIKNADKFFVGVPHMDSILKHLSKSCDVILNTKIQKIVRKNNKWMIYDQNKNSYGSFDWIILSLPAEQSLELITKNISFYPLIKKIKMKSCFSLMVGRNQSMNLDFDAALIENEDIAWLAMNNSKPCRLNNHCLLVNSSYEYAAKNINTSKDKILKHLLNTTSNLINNKLVDSTMIKIHQWRYVEAECSPIDNYFIDHDNKVAMCGDWFINSRVEGAFLSANELSNEFI
ncbi:MAG: NADP transhydrogenase subunit alpha [Rickettsiales bacterium]|nr:NADP transhydrogenase subunit alpha [Rickettsiales bacterium]OUV54501.1 MAG: hypothetical protein CBC87_01165 [Rickettsiales bacterium TMED127]|tara:strand:- start:82367 stop:83344 length:978 start_codon:yes stop_codon:yes gene_type:complete